MFNIGRSLVVFALIAGSAIASASLLVVQGLPSRDARDFPLSPLLAPMGVDGTYTNYDVWVPPVCVEGGWTGFSFANSEPVGCIGLLYDGPANPFANPKNGTSGTFGTKSAIPGNSAKIDWTNTGAPVSAAYDPSTPDGHFGYQFLHLTSCVNNAPTGAWHRMDGGTPCKLSGTSIQLVPFVPPRSPSTLEALQSENASVIVENESEHILQITLAAIPWPEETRDTGEALLRRLRPDDDLFSPASFDGVATITGTVESGGQIQFDLIVPPDETVVLARYLVTSLTDGRVDEYEAFVAFEALKSEREKTPDPDPATPTPTVVTTPTVTPSPTPSRWHIFLPVCYKPEALAVP